MAIYKLQQGKIERLLKTSFSSEGIGEVSDLQTIFLKNPEAIEKGLYVIASEFSNWEESRRRIDILCIDKDANLVVLELKRTEDGGHMELQSIRYAAMIANMTFAKCVKAHEEFLKRNGQEGIDAKQSILDFLDWQEENEQDFGNDVRIILVSSDFSKEITTSVLWLIDRGIDVRCIRMIPQKDGVNLYLDIQQIIPLPEAADYQIQIREKSQEQREARRESSRDYTKYDLIINEKEYLHQNKRQSAFLAIQHCIESGITPESLFKFTEKRRWIWVDEACSSREDFESLEIQNTRKYDPSRYFVKDSELFIVNGKTYAFRNQHGTNTFEMINSIFNAFPQLNAKISESIEV